MPLYTVQVVVDSLQTVEYEIKAENSTEALAKAQKGQTESETLIDAHYANRVVYCETLKKVEPKHE